METTLYYSPSTAATAVHWLLIELDVPHELRLVDVEKGEQKQPAYLALNPAGVVPTLVLDGQILTETPAILLHLADRHPAAGLAPAPGSAERGEYYRWMFWCANTLMPAYRAWFYPQEPAGPGNEAAVQAQARIRIEAAWDRVDAHLRARGPYLLGARMSAVDFMLTILMRWSRNMPRPSDEWTVLRAYARRMKDRPSFAETYRREGITDWL